MKQLTVFGGLRILLLLVLIFLAVSGFAGTALAGAGKASNWPVFPDSNTHHLEATYGSWAKNPGLPPIMHSGIDITVPEFSTTPVYAIEGGYFKTITDRGIETSWRIVIGDASGTDECEAWMYAHIDPYSLASYTFDQYIDAGSYLGFIVNMPPTSYDHLHLSKIRYAGDSLAWAVGQDDWVFTANPLDLLDADNDTMPPVLENALGDQLLAFCQNQSDVYIAEGAPVHGDVDIICLAYDYYNATRFENTPYRFEYRIDGDSSIPWTVSVQFSGETGTYDDMAAYTYIVYQSDATCYTHFNTETGDQEYYYNLTNTDGDLIVEEEDKLRSWETRYFPNGDYKVVVKAMDKTGNTAIDSMTVTTGNFFTLTGNITFDDGIEDLTGSIVTALSTGKSDTTDAAGDFSLGDIPNRTQTFTIERYACQTADTTYFLVCDSQLVLNDIPVEFLRGDANFDGGVNIGDAVYLSNLVFSEGPQPRPYYAGDANSDDNVNVGDVVYLINHIFHDGPPPEPSR
jgi:hypothetical protein